MAFLTLVAAIAAVAAAWIGWQQLTLTRSDVHIQVRFRAPELAVEVEERQRGENAVPFDVQLVALNIGGTRSPKGQLTITVSPSFELATSGEWTADTPNALMPNGASAVCCVLPKVPRNGKVSLPPLQISPRNFTSTGGTRITRCALRWEAWINDRGANSDDLQVKLILN